MQAVKSLRRVAGEEMRSQSKSTVWEKVWAVFSKDWEMKDGLPIGWPSAGGVRGNPPAGPVGVEPVRHRAEIEIEGVVAIVQRRCGGQGVHVERVVRGVRAIEQHAEGFVAYPLGLKGVVVGQGDTYEDALADVRSAIAFHIETFGDEAFADDSPVLKAHLVETDVAV